MAENPNSPADWYADPADPSLHRWWDGDGWTDRLRPAAPLTIVRASRRSRTESAPADAYAVGSATATAVAEYPELPGDGPFTYSTSEMPTKRYRPPVREETQPPRPAAIANKNAASTAASAVAIAVAVGFAAVEYYEVPLAYTFGPSLAALAIALLAFDRARRTGAGVVTSIVALVIAVPLTGVGSWAFATDFAGLIP